MMRRVLVVAGLEAKLLWIQPWVIVLLIFMPGILSAFFARGAVGGPTQAITGMAALFGFFGISSIGLAFYRDHGWMTWDRLRLSSVGQVEIIIGKLLPLGAVFLAQYVVLFALGRFVLQMPWEGSVVGAAMVVIGVVAAELALGFLFAVLCTNVNQLNAISSLVALTLAGVGGALAPVWALPVWIQRVAPASPVYWALEGFRAVTVEPGSVGDVVRPTLILLAIATGSMVVAVLAYDHEKPRSFYA